MSDFAYDVPMHTRDALMRYVNDGLEPGGFLTAVLENNLFEAIGRADMINKHHINDICLYIYNEVPSIAWGSRHAVNEWIAGGGINGRGK